MGHLPKDEEAGGKRGMMFRMGRGQPTLGGSCRVLTGDSKKVTGQKQAKAS